MLVESSGAGPPSMADVHAELKTVWEDLCREHGVIFNFLMGQNGDTLFAGACLYANVLRRRSFPMQDF